MTSIRVFHLIQQAHSALFRAADKHLRTTENITASQQAVLFILMVEDGSPISAIASRLKMGKSSLTGLIDRMAERGLVRREAGKADARVQNVFIEPAGREIVDRSKFTVKRINARLLEPFSADEQRTIERFLQHISDNATEIVHERAASIESRHRKKS